jgi:hypothetical protein
LGCDRASLAAASGRAFATLQRNTAFEHAHAAARQRLLRGEVANFPLGTVAMRVLIGPVRESDGPPLLNGFAAFDQR